MLFEKLYDSFGKHCRNVEDYNENFIEDCTEYGFPWYVMDIQQTTDKVNDKELLQFICELPGVQMFLRNNITNDIDAERIDNMLQMWVEIVPFLNVTEVCLKESYRGNIIRFENNVMDL